MIALLVVVFGSVASADKAKELQLGLLTANKVVAEEGFEKSELGTGWTANKGDWHIEGGCVVGKEKPSDMHAAVLTLAHPHRDSALRFSFKLDGAKGFNVSFNKDRGHLFRVLIAEDGLTISKDKNKRDPSSKPLVLSKAEGKFSPGQWHTILIETAGDKVLVQADNGARAEAKDADLNVDKTGYRFVMRGSSLSLDDLVVRQPAAKADQ